ncbi:unnamed protein product [Paramecium octaurelia]|uniref:Uncharacterized protein n=1 Tax=Paramecium octaurelia TaxID=43137 RepID=A0A8S1SES9_PAROT|nr:unnamed protein product [Paramecium octaurelia]
MISLLRGQYSLQNEVLNKSTLIDFQMVEQIEVDNSDQNCLTFGIWSKYNPLGNSKLKDAYRLFDSNCFQIINSFDQVTLSLNFISYDCVFDTTREIKKFIQIEFSQTDQFIYSLQIEPSKYEDFWYFFQIITNIQKQSLELAIYFQINQIFKETIKLVFPNKDQQLLFTFGGSLKVENSNIALIEQGRIFSLYPGQLIVYNRDMERIPIDFDYWFCECVREIGKNNIHLLFLDQHTNVLQNINCNSYTLAGWLQISKIHQSSEEFTYQFIKISTNQEEMQNENLAAFQLFYQISPIKNKIIITTYKYNFPSVTQDFENNPQLIRRELILQNTITSWQYIYVNLQESVLDFSIIFYEAQNIQSYETTFEVKQFQNYQLKITLGNIQQTTLDYLDVIVRDLLLINCMYDLRQDKCHYSCQECDGPTKYHCLTCSAESKRKYIAEFKQCACIYGTIDDNNYCIDYKDQNFYLDLQFNGKKTTNLNCKMGYFEFDGDCIKCPYGMQKDFLICYDCYRYLDTWSLNPICEHILKLTQVSGKYEAPSILNTYLYDSSDLISTNFNILDFLGNGIQNETLLYDHFRRSSEFFISFCNKETSMDDKQLCYPCRIYNCQSCGLTLNNDLFCLKCLKGNTLVNGQCISDYFNFNYESCQPPYYATYSRECKLCTLENCIYCFEFLYLYEFEISIEVYNLNYENVKGKIGCMLCKKDYNFNFKIGKCLQKAPSIKNCVTSVTKLTNEEICLTSSLDNFQVSREINHCDTILTNCSNCFLDYKNKLTCLVCNSGYVLFGEICYESEEQNASYLNEFWRLKVKSFLINFYQVDEIPPTLNPCGKMCDKCIFSLGEYFCDKCYLEPNGENFDDTNYMCKTCSPLCRLCEQRSIYNQRMAQFLQTPNMNTIYTYQCNLPFIDPFINYNPYLKTTQYCLEGDCKKELNYEFIEYSCFFDRFPRTLDGLGIQTEYLNSIGAVSMTVIIRIVLEDEYCTLIPTIATTASLKFDVFTLEIINLKLLTTYPFFLHIYSQIHIEEYDSFTMIDYGIVFPNLTMEDFNISNSYNEVNFTLINITIKDSLIQNVQSLFKTKNFGYVDLQNISIVNSQFINSSLFNFNKFNLMGNVRINQLHLFNCTFNNLNLFEFSYTQFSISLINLTMDQCSLYNSAVFNFFAQNPFDVQIYLLSISIQRSNFNHSYYFYCSQQIDLIANNLVFNFNELLNSIIFGFSSGLNSSYIEIINNIFIESSFISTIQLINKQLASCNLMYLIIRNNRFQNSNLVRLLSDLSSSELFIRLDNVLIEYNEGLILSSKGQQSYTLNQVSCLFNLNGQTIILNNFSVYQTNKVYILYLFDSQNIELENFTFENSDIEEKVSIQTNCLQNLNFQNQIISITGFNNVSISNLNVKQLQSIDESIIKIISSTQNIQEKIGQITLTNIEFYGNLLQSLNSIIYFSLITIISDSNLYILIKNVVFQNNIMHVYNENSFKDSAALLYFSTLAKCKHNAITNSSNSFIHVESKSLKMINIQVKYHNILPFNIWNNYYNLIQVSQDQIQSLIMQIFQIKTIGGAAYIQTSNFICINSSFEEILTAKISVFDIVSSSDGIIKMQNLSVFQIRNTLQEKIESAGCLSVNAINSLLNLQIQNAKFQNIPNRMSSSIITINPSLLQNKLLFQNMSIINCVSLINQIVKVQFITQANKQNSISFMDLMIYQNLESWVNLFQNIGALSESEIQEITQNNNAMIYLENCDVTIENLFVEGMLFSSVINLNNILSKKIGIIFCYFKIQNQQIQFKFINKYFELFQWFIQQYLEYLLIKSHSNQLDSIRKALNFFKILNFSKRIHVYCQQFLKLRIRIYINQLLHVWLFYIEFFSSAFIEKLLLQQYNIALIIKPTTNLDIICQELVKL